MTPSRPAILCFLLFAGFVPLLVVVPTLVPPDPTVLSAASKAGYNTVLAYQAVALWVALSFVVIWAAARQGWLPLASTTNTARLSMRSSLT